MPIINDNFTLRAPVPIDDRLGWWDGSDWQPFTSRQDALDKIEFYRYITLTLPVVEDGDVVEYWFKGGITDDDFVLKTFEVDLSDYYTKTEADALLLGKADVSELLNYYTKTELQTPGDAIVDWSNIANVPDFATDWASITGDQSVVGNAGFNNTANFITIDDLPELAEVAYSGDYNDLINLPTIPDLTGYATEQWVLDQNYITGVSWNQIAGSQSTIQVGGFANAIGYITLDEVPAQVQSDWNASSGLAEILNKPVLATVATTGDFNDLINQPSIPDLSGYATEAWVTSQNYLTSVSSSWDINTGDLAIQENIYNLDGRYMLRSNTITSGYGIIASANFDGPVSIELNTGVTDSRYLRKDQNDATSYNLSVGGELDVTDVTTLNGYVYMTGLPRGGGVATHLLSIEPLSGLVGYIPMPSFSSSFWVRDNSGTAQFSVEDDIRFAGAGDASVSFNPATNTVTITSVPGAGGGGVITSVFGRTTSAIVAEVGDYNTSQVPEGTNQYFTQARVRSTAMTGLPLSSNAIVATDSLLTAIGKAQGQINARVPTSRSISINGTSGNITVSGGTQTLTANTSWTANLATVGTAGTRTKVTVDAYGRVTGGSALAMSDLPSEVTQTLSTGSNPGNLIISGGNSIYLYNLRSVNRQDGNERRKYNSFEPYTVNSGSTNYPSTVTAAGFRVERRSTDTSQLGMDFWTSGGGATGSEPTVYFKTFGGLANESSWQQIATRSWVNAQIPSNYVTTNTNQTGLSGTKSWTAAHSWTSTAGAPSASNAVQVGGSSNGQYLRIQKQGEATQSIIVRGYEIDGVQLVLNEGGLDGPQGSNSTNTPILFAGGNPLLGRSTVGALSLMAWNNNLILKPNGTSTDGQVIIATTGQVTVAGLSGSGTQMVTVNGSGVLSRQAIPAVGVTSVDAGNGMNFTTITGSGSVTLGTPGNITLSSTNSVTSTSHTHNFAPGGTTAQYIRGDGSLATFPSIPAGDITGVTAGTGLSGGGTSGTVTLNIAAAYSPNTSTSLGTADLNATTTPGFYHQTSSSNATTARNYPVAVAGNLQVYKDPGVTQRYNAYNTGATYVRNYYSSAWTAWTRVDYRSHTHTWGSLTGTIGTIPGAGASGTYGSLNISGLKQGYAGINFADVGNALFMVNASARSGLYKGGWVWAFEGDGTLYAGTVPWARLTGVPTIIPTSRTISAGNGLTGGGSLAANRTITLATPGTITGSTTNSVSASSHTHSLTLASGDITGALGFTPVTTARTITMTGGSGITSSAGSQTLAGNRTWTISLTSITAGSGTVGALRYSGTTRTTGQMYGGSTNPNGTTRLNYSGILHAYDFIGYGSSDERLKDHITPIVDPIGKLSQLGGYSFKWKPGHDSYQGNDYGLIAQEVEKVLPEIVVERGGVKAIKTGNQLIGLLVAGFNELSKRVEALENGIS